MNLRKFIPMAQQAAALSKDPSTKVGALVIDRRGAIRATGYNGFPRGVDDDPRRYADRPTKLKLIAHAEANAIANAAAVGTPLDGCSLVVTKFPCHECAKLVINAGIAHVLAPKPVGSWVDSNNTATFMLVEAGVTIDTYGEEE